MNAAQRTFLCELVSLRYGEHLGEQAFEDEKPLRLEESSLAFESGREAWAWIVKTILRAGEVGGLLDRWGGYERSASELFARRLDQEPMADRVLATLVERHCGGAKPVLWPNGARAVVCLSHDVDGFSGFNH